MTEKLPELVSKKRVIVNSPSFYMVPRSAIGSDPDGVTSLQTDSYELQAGGNYFMAPSSDKLRIVVGKNWDHAKKDLNSATDKKVFANDWPEIRAFYDNPIELDFCEGTWEEIYGEEQNDPLHPPYGLATKEKIILKSKVNMLGGDPKFLVNWLYYIKTGIVSPSGFEFEPIIRSANGAGGKVVYYDHYHEAINPFTPAELTTKSAVGKSFFADFKTYYNERLNSSYFENYVGPRNEIQNSLPSIYAFLRLLLNDNLEQDSFFQFGSILQELSALHDSTNSNILKNMYKTILKKYPLESLVLLYGMIGRDHSDETALFLGAGPEGALYDNTKIVEKIISISFENIDADSLFYNYYNEYVRIHEMDPKLKYSPSGANQYYDKILALENIMTNLVFSASSLKFLNKVDQYKKHFPFYSELQFTANVHTSLGDSMKDLFLTKTISEAVLNNNPKYSWSWASELSQNKNFTEFAEETIYEDLSFSSSVESEKNKVSFPIKRIQPFDVIAKSLAKQEEWHPEGEGVYFGEQKNADNFDEADLRNFITHFKNSYTEPVNLDDDCNIIFKKIFTGTFYTKILETYHQKRRTYREILEGVPAYTEDLFYKIEKVKKHTDASGEQIEEVVQNILIPNTSELDIVKYVDTQLKYCNQHSNNTMYKYNVYTHRIVFGAKYRYIWLSPDEDDDGDKIPVYASEDSTQPLYYEKIAVDDETVDLTATPELGFGLTFNENLSDVPSKGDDPFDPFGKVPVQPYIESTDLYATLRVDVNPDILLIEDKIFSTPDIIIIDKPPVSPDINIVPYRAINNRIKILMTGATDRYKMKPVIMLDSDIQEFELIKKAQLVVDDSGNPLLNGKVEFGSDDPVGTFQLFRTLQRPKSYSDFELYDQVTQGVYEEKILPNTRYYYTFRAIDNHGHVSNPTPVYEVELIDEKGAVKPLIRTIDMTPQKNRAVVKDCQKYLLIRPSLKQLYFSHDPEVDGIFSNDNKKKRYKMRITSKGSGKKIDINFSYKLKDYANLDEEHSGDQSNPPGQQQNVDDPGD